MMRRWLAANLWLVWTGWESVMFLLSDNQQQVLQKVAVRFSLWRIPDFWSCFFWILRRAFLEVYPQASWLFLFQDTGSRHPCCPSLTTWSCLLLDTSSGLPLGLSSGFLVVSLTGSLTTWCCLLLDTLSGLVRKTDEGGRHPAASKLSSHTSRIGGSW